MYSRKREKQRLLYMEMWRVYYAVIILGSGGAMTYFSARSGNVVFAIVVAALTLAAVAILIARTFRRQHRRVAKPAKPAKPANIRRFERR